jgi:signal peptidase
MLATLAVVIAIASHLSRPGQYTVFGHPVLTVMSGSMSPTIRTGDLVYDGTLSPGAADHLRPGEIITFRETPGSYQTITHRIHAVLRIDGSVAYQTKGDDNLAPDRVLVAPGQVVGLYRGRIPYGGYVLSSLHHPLSLALLLAAPFLWVLSGWFFGLAREAEPGDGGRSMEKGREEAPM